MGKNDFDIDFDFEDEDDFDPRAFLGTEEYDDDIDLSAFSDEELGLTSPDPVADAADEELDCDFIMGEEMNLDDFLNMSNAPAEPAYGQETADEYYRDPEFPEYPQETEDYAEEEEYLYPSEPDFTEDAEPEVTEMIDTMDYSVESDLTEQDTFEDEPVYDEALQEEAAPRKPAFKMPKLPKITMPKITTPNIFTKFYDLYFAPVLNKELREEKPDPNNPRRRRRKSKVQIFKEVYLPPIIVCVCMILVLSFTIGSVSNLIEQRRIDREAEQSRLDESKSAEAVAEQKYQEVMAEAAALATVYDYDGAIAKLDSFGDMSAYPEMQAKRSEYVTAQSQLVAHNDPSLIPNLSFHVLIADPVRAFNDTDNLAGSYNRNFVTTDEFTKILQQLYDNGYVLVDFNSFTDSSEDVNGGKMFFSVPIYLPADKKPVMITETMVNYFGYMIDSDEDGVADAKGDGFASRLVVQNGQIKAEYVDANGNVQVGNYDLVPILEDFIAEHPDFCYRGARATLAVCGYEGIFGYRINSSYVATKGTAYQEEQIAGAKQIVQALRDKGYTIACYTYGNEAYGQFSAAQITADLQLWTQQITPVIGEVDTLVFARTSNITDYGGNAFTVLYTSGFRYFVGHGTQPSADVNTTYVRQNRLMVTGNSMAWYPKQFTDLGLFDPNLVLDMTNRVSVPNG